MCLMNALKYHWCKTCLLSQAGIKHVVSKDFIFREVCSRDQFCILPRMKKSMASFHIKNFSCHDHYFKKNVNVWVTSSCVGHMWVTSGLFCGSTGVTQFQHYQVPITLFATPIHSSVMHSHSHG